MAYISPSQSKAHLVLRRRAEQAGFEGQAVREFLWLINADDRLTAFVGVCERLKQRLVEISHYLGVSPTDFRMDQWPAIADWVISNRSELSAAIGKYFDRQPRPTTGKGRRSSPNPVYGHAASRNPLYALFWNSHRDQQQRRRFFLLVDHLLLAHARLMPKYVTLEEYEAYGGNNLIAGLPHTLYSATLVMRQLSDERFPLSPALNPHMSPYAFAEVAAQFKPSVEGSAADRCLVPYCHFIAEAYGKRHRRKKAKTSRTSGTRRPVERRRFPGYVDLSPQRQILPTEIQDTGDLDYDWGTMAVVTETKNINERRHTELEKQDLCPAELTDDNEIYLAEFECEETKKGAAGLALAARGRLRHLQMEHQHLVWRYPELTTNELADLLMTCSQQFRELAKSPRWSDDDCLRAETIALVHVMLWTGSTLEAARELLVARDPPPSADLALCTGGVSDTSKGASAEWRVRTYVPPYRTDISAPPGIAREREDYMFIPDVARGARFVVDLLVRSEYPDKTRPFMREPRVYATSLSRMLKQIDASGRITKQKLTSWLFHRLVIASGDIAAAVAITGKFNTLAEARIFYSTPDLNRLRNIYLVAVDELVVRISMIAGKASPTTTVAMLSYVDKHVGSRLCATESAVRRAVASIKTRLADGVAGIDERTVVSYHNLYTLYSVLVFAYTTACRPIVTPFLASQEIDEDSGFAVLTDKDGLDHYKSRLVYVTKESLLQIRNYERHRAALLGSFAQLPAPYENPSDLPACFFLEQVGSTFYCQEVREKTLTEAMKPFLPLPANAHRRFMRNTLLEEGCPPEVVDAYMGHWSRGEEPWGKYSSFSFDDYRQTLGPHLIQILDLLGFEPFESSIVSSGLQVRS